MAMHYHLI
ncbi:hypothetical protein Pint_25853 [Pistacia integerrima]|uniref:Uncharacterized protein n=1 Tax=Pistacia integerrima TaxID=434235 RepID=A0ACC0YF43_9ROSI|nr:hypothetical protein Pint_25853 [Pistacia integerrima]